MENSTWILMSMKKYIRFEKLLIWTIKVTTSTQLHKKLDSVHLFHTYSVSVWHLGYKIKFARIAHKHQRALEIFQQGLGSSKKSSDVIWAVH